MAGIDPRTRATTEQFGVTRFAKDGESRSDRAVRANDPRLAGSKHAATHKKGGSDAIKLDELADPTDNTNGDATTARHGLMSKTDKQKLDGTGAMSVVATVPLNTAGANKDIAFVLADLGIYYKTGGVWTLFGKVATVTDSAAIFKTPTAGDGTAELATS